MPIVQITRLQQLPQDAPTILIDDVDLNRAGQRVVIRRTNGAIPSTMMKCSTVTVTDSRNKPAAAAIPMAADSQIDAAVVSPTTAPRRVMTIPAPRKPIPETICAATRETDLG